MSIDATGYRKVEVTIRQGDIFEDLPLAGAVSVPVMVTGKPQLLRGSTVVQVFGGTSTHPLPNSFRSGSVHGAIVPSAMTRVILLSRGCEVDKAKVVQVARVRPMTTITSGEVQGRVVEGLVKYCHYLPPNDEFQLPPSYVDFRTIASVDRTALNLAPRVVGLTHAGLHWLYLGIIRHMTGLVVSLVGTCDACGADVPLLSQLQDALVPPDDF